jgi:hypothetical protein
MVKHIVLWKLKSHAEGADRQENTLRLRGCLQALPEAIKEIRTFEVGLPLAPSEGGFDLALYSAFDSRDDMARYASHPAHQEVLSFVKAITSELVVVDYEV